MNDLRFALRQLRKAPAFTVTALATVAICLGANMAIFAVINSILLRPLPFPNADRLVTILQHLSESRRRERWLVGHKLFRAARQHPGFLEPVHLPQSRRARRRVRFDQAGRNHPRVGRIFHDAWRGLAMGRPFTEAEHGGR